MNILMIAVLLCAPCGAWGAEWTVTAEMKALAERNNAFALDLYAQLKGGKGNLFCSPYSISSALAMTYAGAKGRTAQEMGDVLHFTRLGERLHTAMGELSGLLKTGNKAGYKLSIANALWGQKGAGFLKDYLDLTRTRYGAMLREMDFKKDSEGARQTINAWVAQETQSKIKDLIGKGGLNALTRLVLTNAIYFKGDWETAFKKTLTQDAPFRMDGDREVKVPMMNRQDKFRYMETEDFQALELPYKGKDLSMVVFLPKKIDGLPEFEDSLSFGNLTGWLGRLGSEEVKVYLPRFKTTAQFQLAATLNAMGMKDAFSETAADFSGMNGKRSGDEALSISQVIHKAFVDVNEEGTEAAAATAVTMIARSAAVHRPREIPVFRADHPFFFLIRDNRTGSLLFLGRYTEPGR